MSGRLPGIGGKADKNFAARMSAYDPKRTLGNPSRPLNFTVTIARPQPRGATMRRRGAKENNRGRKAARPKRRNATGRSHRHGASNANLQEQLAQRTRELDEALERQAATAGVLKAISRSTFNLQSVLDSLVQSAARLCDADIAVIGRPRGTTYYFEATHGYSPELAEFVASHPAQIDRGTISGRVLVERKIIQVADVLADPEYTYEGAQKIGFFRTILGVPLLREGTPIGVLTLSRNSVRPFTE